jgi:hypothetical protein
MLKPLLIAALLAPAAASAQPAAKPCAAPENRQFDFWVGHWRVSPTGQDKVVAESLIERLYDGCAIRENWMPKGRAGGGSLNAYVPAEHGWRQTWVDSSGELVDFRGGWTGKAMVLTGPGHAPSGEPRLLRMTFTTSPDGSVRQFGEESGDAGKTWTARYDLTYRPAKP